MFDKTIHFCGMGTKPITHTRNRKPYAAYISHLLHNVALWGHIKDVWFKCLHSNVLPLGAKMRTWLIIKFF